ncbi:MAG: hypothetical protein WAT93_10040 [Pontixanthobacter sp.]
MTKTAKFLAPILGPALVASLMLSAAAPASAASVNLNHGPMLEISQLDRQIDRALVTRKISRTEAAMFDRKVDQLRRTYHQYARGGLNRAELRALDRQISRVEAQLRHEMRDRDNRYSQQRGDFHDRSDIQSKARGNYRR